MNNFLRLAFKAGQEKTHNREKAQPGLSRIYKFLAACLTLVLFTLPSTGLAEICLTDMVGRKVTLPHHAKRLVTTFKPATLCAISLGLGPNLVGVDFGSRKDRLQLAVCPSLAKAVGVGDKTGGLNVESIVELKPDLVVLFSQKTGIGIADRLEKLGIPSLIILPESYESLKETMRILAKGTGTEKKAAQVEEAMDHAVSLVAKNLGDLSEEQRRVVYYASPQGFFRTASGNMLQDEMIRLAGGKNAAGKLEGYFRTISPEQLLIWNPSLIACCSRVRPGIKQAISRPEIQKVQAVAKNRVYVFPCNIAPWDFPSPLSALGVLWLAKRLYPEKMSKVDLKSEIDRFHQAVFCMDFKSLGGYLNDRIKP